MKNDDNFHKQPNGNEEYQKEKRRENMGNASIN